jgi:hypothetical protein
MDRLKRFAIKKVTDGLDKVLEAKAHFDKREDKKSYTKKILELKKTLTDTVFRGEEKDKSEAYKNLGILDKILTEHEISTKDKKVVDDLYAKYK